MKNKFYWTITFSTRFTDNEVVYWDREKYTLKEAKERMAKLHFKPEEYTIE